MGRVVPGAAGILYRCAMDIAGFDLNLLKAFDALYAERHVTRAGQRIGLSQSAMSGALTRLREVFGDELFVRSPAGMQPTPRADDLAGPISAALRLMRGARGSLCQALQIAFAAFGRALLKRGGHLLNNRVQHDRVLSRRGTGLQCNGLTPALTHARSNPDVQGAQ